jgi:hypothetical protein
MYSNMGLDLIGLFDCCVELYQTLQDSFGWKNDPKRISRNGSRAVSIVAPSKASISQSNLTFPTRLSTQTDKDNLTMVRPTQEPVVDKLKMKTLTIRGQVEGHRGLSRLHKYLPSALPTTMTLLLLPSHPAKKKRKKRKKPSERSAQENLEAMRESRARNLPPSSDEDDDLHKNPSALDLGVFTQYSADQDDVSNGDGTAVTALLPMVLQALQSMPTTSLLLTKTQAAATTAMALMPKGMMMTLLLEMILMVKVQWCLKQ